MIATATLANPNVLATTYAPVTETILPARNATIALKAAVKNASNSIVTIAIRAVILSM